MEKLFEYLSDLLTETLMMLENRWWTRLHFVIDFILLMEKLTDLLLKELLLDSSMGNMIG